MSSAAQAVASPYLPIEHYGIIGDLQTVALVGINGSIDWYCYSTWAPCPSSSTSPTPTC
jgi:hypothetical protein